MAFEVDRLVPGTAGAIAQRRLPAPGLLLTARKRHLFGNCRSGGGNSLGNRASVVRTAIFKSE